MPFSSDTSPQARRVVIEALRRMTPQQRAAKAFEMTGFLIDLTKAGVARDYPQVSETERFDEFLRRWLGTPLAEKVIDARGRRPPGTSSLSDARS